MITTELINDIREILNFGIELHENKYMYGVYLRGNKICNSGNDLELSESNLNGSIDFILHHIENYLNLREESIIIRYEIKRYLAEKFAKFVKETLL